jgi:basic membrane lipoprotein Med (substrate-binding protein (PBP1-ABC) superfamily)
MLAGMATARTWRWVAAVAVSTVVAGGLAWWLWPSRPPAEEPLVRQYREFTVCLLTDERGVGGPEAQPMWAGIQEAALAAQVRSQYLSVTGPQTADNAATFLASMAQGQCDMVFAAGAAPAEAVRATARTFPQTRFYLVDPRTSAGNVSGVAAADLRGSAKGLVATAAAAAAATR